MEIIKALTQIGLSEKESRTYVACLQQGIGTVLNIASAANLKRPSTYLLLEDLEKKGLVSKTKKGKKTFFKAESPKRILTDLKLKEGLVEDILPTLSAIYNIDPQKPNIKIAEGVNGVRSVYNGIFTHLANNPEEELLIFGSLKDASQYFEKEVLDYFHFVMKTSKNSIREIGNDDTATRQYYRKSARLNPRHSIRLIRKEGRFQNTDNMIYGNTLVIFSVDQQIFATILESPHIVKTYRTLFNMAWKSGKRI